MGGYGTNTGQMGMMLPYQESTGAKPGAGATHVSQLPGFNQGGGIGTKPGGRMPSSDTWAMARPQPQPYPNTGWPNENAPAPGTNPLNPVPAWYQGNAPFRAVEHPSPFIGRGVQQHGRLNLRSLAGNPNPNQQAPQQQQPQQSTF